ncbi:MAG: ABC transporter ATP-binding protein [Tannerellaceae bacterium]|jgi:ABC-type multidrug transport system ATPase subunit|nr:ABC transporter ATP-binding protein [Tannerellaceae bacterium]
MSIIELNNVSYSVKGRDILNEITFSLNKGDRLAILGHNGSGKTTLLEIMTDITKPRTGKVLYQGYGFKSVKKEVGVVWDNITFFQWLKPKEVIEYVSSMYKKNINHSLYELLEIGRFENNLMRKLSQGERKRVQIYIATFHNPNYLLLDEATSEIDPLMKDRIWQDVFLGTAKTLIFTTHQWEEAEKYATKFLFLHKGNMMNSPKEIKELIAESNLSKKVVVHNSIDLVGINIFSYEYENNKVFLIENGDEKTFDLIKKQTLNYTSLSIDIKDLFYFYSK